MPIRARLKTDASDDRNGWITPEPSEADMAAYSYIEIPDGPRNILAPGVVAEQVVAMQNFMGLVGYVTFVSRVGDGALSYPNCNVARVWIDEARPLPVTMRSEVSTRVGNEVIRHAPVREQEARHYSHHINIDVSMGREADSLVYPFANGTLRVDCHDNR